MSRTASPVNVLGERRRQTIPRPRCVLHGPLETRGNILTRRYSSAHPFEDDPSQAATRRVLNQSDPCVLVGHVTPA